MSTQNIEDLRTQIKEINTEIIELIAKRTDVAEQIGHRKKQCGLSVHQPKQEAKVLQQCKSTAAEAGISPDKITDVFTVLMTIARQRQHDQG